MCNREISSRRIDWFFPRSSTTIRGRSPGGGSHQPPPPLHGRRWQNTEYGRGLRHQLLRLVTSGTLIFFSRSSSSIRGEAARGCTNPLHTCAVEGCKMILPARVNPYKAGVDSGIGVGVGVDSGWSESESKSPGNSSTPQPCPKLW